MEEPEVFEDFFEQLEPRGDKLVTRLKDFQLGKDIMKNKLISLQGLKPGTDLYRLFNSLEKHHLLMLLNGLGIKFLDILELAVKCPKPLEGVAGDNMRRDQQLAK